MSNEKAIKYISEETLEECDYYRPIFEYPDLESPEANPYFVKDAIASLLEKNGYMVEAQNIKNIFLKTKYEDMLNIQYRLVEFQEVTESEEDGYTIVRKKTNPKGVDVSQPEFIESVLRGRYFQLKRNGLVDKEKIRTINIYDKNILSYMVNDSFIKVYNDIMNPENDYAFEAKDLMCFDKMLSSPIMETKSLEIFTDMLCKMVEEAPYFIKDYTFHTNRMGVSIYSNMLTIFNNIIFNNRDKDFKFIKSNVLDVYFNKIEPELKKSGMAQEDLNSIINLNIINDVLEKLKAAKIKGVPEKETIVAEFIKRDLDSNLEKESVVKRRKL